MAAVQTVMRMMRRVVAAADGGGGEGVEAGQTRPGQESRPVGRVLWVLHHHRASLGGAVHVILGQGVASRTTHTCFALSLVFCTFSADVQGFVPLKTPIFVHSLVTCTLRRFRVSAHLAYPFVYSLFRPFSADVRIIQVQGFFTLETHPFVHSLVMCTLYGFRGSPH